MMYIEGVRNLSKTATVLGWTFYLKVQWLGEQSGSFKHCRSSQWLHDVFAIQAGNCNERTQINENTMDTKQNKIMNSVNCGKIALVQILCSM